VKSRSRIKLALQPRRAESRLSEGTILSDDHPVR
jgi:hypothetical protein